MRWHVKGKDTKRIVEADTCFDALYELPEFNEKGVTFRIVRKSSKCWEVHLTNPHAVYKICLIKEKG